ncbi:MAG: hypothetical protein NC408_08030 [Candidatus Gastranaerophilales bacterium]|nr:hypothetical protein [Candidatus Gastranaerophilales bacterium]MCM1072435.1 hypothetical protein [Bacteroides sp.]
MKKLYIYLLFLLCTSIPTFAADWVQIPGTKTYFDKESIKIKGENIYSIETKSPANNGLEWRNIFIINGNTKKFNLNEVKLIDPKNQTVIKSKKYYDWDEMEKGSNIYNIYQLILVLTTHKVKTKDTVIHETLQINPNIEMLMGHEYYKGIKIKSIKVKQVELEKDNIIKNGNVIEGEPNCFSVIVEITDMKGNIIKLFGIKTLSQEDYAIKIKE